MKNKNKIYIILGVIAVVLVAICGSCVATRNKLVSLDQNVKKAWGNVEAQYQRRIDLIPNLVNTVKGYAAHESSTLQDVTDARTGYKSKLDDLRQAQADAIEAHDASVAGFNPETAARQAEAQQNLMRQAQIYVNAVHEAYPDLKANTNFLDLQAQLEGTENRIAKARTDFNDAVEKYNNKVLRFPGSLFAWGYQEKEMFNAAAGADRAPVVDFGGNGAPGAPAVGF